MACLLPPAAGAQTRGEQLTLESARQRALQSSPAVAAARAAAEAAAARERQSGAFPNPVLSYGREQTGASGISTSQDVLAVEQRIEIAGQRSARLAAAALRREAAEARLALSIADLNAEAARVYAEALAADRKHQLATDAAAQFTRAAAVMNRRLSEGDVSGYAARRVRLEAARYAAFAAEAALARREARIRLERLTAGTSDISLAGLEAIAAPEFNVVALTRDSIVAIALARSPDVRVTDTELRIAQADARVIARERIPTPALSAGYKGERTTDDQRLNGFVAGVSVPLPIWDRRSAAVAATTADIRRVEFEREVVRRRIGREAEAAWEAVRRADEQVQLLRAQLGEEARTAVRAAETAYAEGEITLVEWLDAVRAYQEAETSYATVLAQSFTQRATLERLLGSALLR
jgi:cobalt-zinc-cadmium efflux system outer membrane protein